MQTFVILLYEATCFVPPLRVPLAYYGMTYDLTKRKKWHFASARSRQRDPFHSAIREYGEERFHFKIISEVHTDSRGEGFMAEKALIQQMAVVCDSHIKLLNVVHNPLRRSRRATSPILGTTAGTLLQSTLASLPPRYREVQEQVLGKFSARPATINPKAQKCIDLTSGLDFESMSQAAEAEDCSPLAIARACETGEPLKNGNRYAYINGSGIISFREGHVLHRERTQRVVCLNDIPDDKLDIQSGWFDPSATYIYGSTKDAGIRREKEYGSAPRNGLDPKGKKDVQRLPAWQRKMLKLYSVCNGKYKTTSSGNCYCYVKADNSLDLRDSHRQFLEDRASKRILSAYKYGAWPKQYEWIPENEIIIRSELKFADTVQDLLRILKISASQKGHAMAVISGKRPAVGDFRMAVFDCKTETPTLTPRHTKYSPSRRDRSFAVYCPEMQRTFDTPEKASAATGVSVDVVVDCCYGKRLSGGKRSDPSKGGYHFYKVVEDDLLEEYDTHRRQGALWGVQAFTIARPGQPLKVLYSRAQAIAEGFGWRTLKNGKGPEVAKKHSITLEPLPGFRTMGEHGKKQPKGEQRKPPSHRTQHSTAVNLVTKDQANSMYAPSGPISQTLF
jgi:hypothetical protein